MIQLNIVCVYNNKKKLNDLLIASLSKQKDCMYQLILVDNTNNQYDSACKALNYGCSQADGKYIMILHQDILFRNEYELKNIYDQCEKIKEFGVIGVAGRNEGLISHTLSSITDRIPEQECSKYKVTNLTECQTVDECLFIIKNNDFKQQHFDENNKSWHLYAVEYSIAMKLKGKSNYVIDSSIYHVSNALSLDDSYFKELLRFSRSIKYYNKIDKIYTTCGIWEFRNFSGKLKIIEILIKQLIKKYMRKIQ